MTIRLSLPRGHYLYKGTYIEHSHIGSWHVMTRGWESEKIRQTRADKINFPEFMELSKEEMAKYLQSY